MPRRFVVLHGHFYQPPRENPWIEEVEVEDSAQPFHDWNARITAECYGPNGAARLKTPAGRIVDIVNNYRHISFNFGPTLLTWLERHAPDVYGGILEADATSRRTRGHGNAIAQGYNHAILPLCSPRDRVTQVRWGIADFRHRFGRDPEGLWLPETAADRATLEVLVAEGIRFTILSPFQATRVCPPGGAWQDATEARFDPTRPYRVLLGGGRSIVVFFYDGPIARRLAFGEGLASGDELVHCLEDGFDARRDHDEVLTVAVDGETFGHHKKGGDEALGAALRQLGARDDVRLTNFGQLLDLVPVEWEAEIAEGSSWSCAHGIERWRSDCGCQTSGQPGWRQHWRAPLRRALDQLRDRLALLFEREAGQLLLDPWAARDEFIALVLDPARCAAPEFIAERARPGRCHGAHEQVRALKLLEMQRQAMLMYTSCGWFFSEVSGLETVQVLKYAARALQLAHEISGRLDLEPMFKEALASVPSNLPELGNAARVYERYVTPSLVTLEGVAAHHAIANLFENESGPGQLFCFRYNVLHRRREIVSSATLAVGQIEIESLVTQDRMEAIFCVLHFGGSDFRCGFRPTSASGGSLPDTLGAIERALFAKLERLSLAELVRELDNFFPGREYTLRDLFRDGRRRLEELLLADTLGRYHRVYEEIFTANRPLMQFLREIDSPVPTPLRVAADVCLSQQLVELSEQLGARQLPLADARFEMRRRTDLAKLLGARLDLGAITRSFNRLLRERAVELCTLWPPSGAAVETSGGEAMSAGEVALELADLARLGEELGLSVDLWQVQNLIWAWVASGRCPLPAETFVELGRGLWFDDPVLGRRAAATARPLAAQLPPEPAAPAAEHAGLGQ